MSRELPRLPRALLALVLPPERREEFIGDLLEEADQRQARHGAQHAERWLWMQVLRSWPNLAVARLRRAPVAVPVAAAAGLPAVFLGGARLAPRSLAVAVSIAVHLLLFGYLAVRGVWAVDELAAPAVHITFHNFMPAAAPPVFGALKPAARDKSRWRTPSTLTPTTVPVALVQATRDTGIGHKTDDGRGTPDAPPGDNVCPAGTDCGGPSPDAAHFLPPRVGEKSCVSCQPPHLPEAYLRLGNTYQVMVRICVSKDGGVDSVKVLQGLGGAADASVLGTVAGWRFTPYEIDGRPVPFCYATRFTFSAM
jgi:TonB family protein